METGLLYRELLTLLLFALSPGGLGNPLYPHGISNGDYVGPRVDDGSTERIDIGVDFPFFDEYYSSLYVNTNGLVSFRETIGQFKPQAFPLGDMRRVVAPFWADVDTTRKGDIYYRSSTDQTLLDKATADVKRAFVDQTRFRSSWAFVVTWAGVTNYNGRANFFSCLVDGRPSCPKNTFQLVLTTNGRHSFAIFNYGDITWTLGAASKNIYAQAGFNAGDGVRYYSIPGSLTSSIGDIEKTSNVNIPGRWVFRIDAADVISGGCNTKGKLVLSAFRGSMLGGTGIQISGPCYTATDQVVCKFNDTLVPGSLTGLMRATCFTPPMFSKEKIPLSLSVDGGSTFPYNAYFQPEYSPDEAVYRVERVDPKAWLSGGPYLIKWKTGDIATSKVDIDLLALYKQYNKAATVLPHYWQEVGRDVPNTGSADVQKLIRKCSAQAYVGAIRISPAGSAAENVQKKPVIWSDLHTLQWYVHAYLATRLLDISLPVTWTSIYIQDLLEGLRYSSVLDEKSPWTDALAYVNQYDSRSEVGKVLCTDWLDVDRGNTVNPVALSVLPPCPCTLQQAERDLARYEVDMSCFRGSNRPDNCELNPGAVHCVRSTMCGKSGIGLQCCYNQAGDLIDVRDSKYVNGVGHAVGGGTLDRSHPTCQNPKLIPHLSHFLDDVLPQHICCMWTSKREWAKNAGYCIDTYLISRASRDCKGYVPPRPASGFGDPHIVTLDGVRYMFNGVGEYVILQLKNNNFTLQGRTQQVTGALMKATAWSAFVVRSALSNLTIQLTSGRQGMIRVLVNGERMDYADTDRYNLEGATVQLILDPNNSSRSGINVAFREENIFLEVKSIEDVLHFMLYLPEESKGMTRGLLGSWNDDPADDFVGRNGNVLPANAALRDIHYDFGETWRVDETSSLFTYDMGRPFQYFQNPGFVPTFGLTKGTSSETMQKAVEMCGDDNAECLFDYVITGSAERARTSKSMMAEYKQAIKDTKKVVTCGYLETPRNCTKFADNYLEGSQVTFKCDVGFVLEGSKVRECLSDGTWNGEVTVCKKGEFTLYH